MKKEIFEGLIENEKVDLIYSTTRFAGEKMYINYTIICDIHSATEDVKLLETIVATMYVIKELLSKHKIAFSYTVKTSEEFENEITKNYSVVVKRLIDSEILYSKDNYYADIIEETKQQSKRA